MSVGDIRARFDFRPDTLKDAASILGFALPPADAPKHFEFHQRRTTERATDDSGFCIRERGEDGIHRWKTHTWGWWEMWLCFTGTGLQINLYDYVTPVPRTLDDAKRAACEIAERYGFEPKYVPTGAEATRAKLKARIVSFPISATAPAKEPE
jgi:hypothetical protein